MKEELSLTITGKYADVGHATLDNWVSQRTDIGIYGTNKGVTSLLSDLGSGNMGVVDWGTYNTDHTYFTEIPGNDSPLFLHVYDVYYINNSGNLYADIFVKLN